MGIITKIELTNIIVGGWKSELNDMIYIFSDTPSCLKTGSLDLLVSNIKSGKYVLIYYSIVEEEGTIFLEVDDEKFQVRSYALVQNSGEIHLGHEGGDVLVLKRL